MKYLKYYDQTLILFENTLQKCLPFIYIKFNCLIMLPKLSANALFLPINE